MGSTSSLDALKYLYFFISFFHFVIFGCSLCIDSERSALWEFKNSFSINISASNGPSPFPKVSSWKTGENASECCSWDGVECHEKTGHVIGLDLQSSLLYGSINSSSTLFTLVHLRRLNLADNNFKYSQIPSGISLLPYLSILNLSSSVFSGQIPSELLGLSRLVSLDLSTNVDHSYNNGRLILEKPSFANLVHNLTKLQVLKLDSVSINSMVPVTLVNMTSLTALSLQDCELFGDFPRKIFFFPSLQSLCLFKNVNLSGSLPEFHQKSSLTQLMLSYTNFFGPIPNSIGNLTELTYLSASFSSVDVGRLLWLSKLYKLRSLFLDSINLQGVFPSSLANLTQLNESGLHSNELVGPIPLWLSNLTQLTFLDISLNQLQGQIPQSFSNLKNLELVNLHANHLSGTVEVNIFFSLENLSQLLLSGNNLSLLTNNVTYSSLPRLGLLALGSCNLRVFPEFLRFQDKLQVLSLTQNKITKTPEWMWNTSNETSIGYPVLPWKSLRILDITYNMIQGPIPIPPAMASFYYASNNQFSGEIPQAFCKLSSVSILDLSNNNMSGKIPPCLGNLRSSLTVLNLKDNKFTGTFHDMYTEECSLRMINLSQNQIVGRIPSSLTSCKGLEILDLCWDLCLESISI